jgi:hypothetical protein
VIWQNIGHKFGGNTMHTQCRCQNCWYVPQPIPISIARAWMVWRWSSRMRCWSLATAWAVVQLMGLLVCRSPQWMSDWP